MKMSIQAMAGLAAMITITLMTATPGRADRGGVRTIRESVAEKLLGQLDIVLVDGAGTRCATPSQSCYALVTAKKPANVEQGSGPQSSVLIFQLARKMRWNGRPTVDAESVSEAAALPAQVQAAVNALKNGEQVALASEGYP